MDGDARIIGRDYDSNYLERQPRQYALFRYSVILPSGAATAAAPVCASPDIEEAFH